MSLASLTRAKRHSVFNGVSNELIQDLLDSASKLIINYCNREFDAATDTTETLDGDDQCFLFLKRLPITSIKNITVALCDGTTDTIDGTDLTFNAQTGEVQFAIDNDSGYDYFPIGFQNIVVTYSGGYSTIPEDLQDACIQLAVGMKEVCSGSTAIQSETIGDYSYTLNARQYGDSIISPSVRSILNCYRLIYV